MLLVTLREVTDLNPTLLYQRLDDKVDAAQTDLKVSGDLALISAWFIRQVRQDIEFFFVRHGFRQATARKCPYWTRPHSMKFVLILTLVHPVNRDKFLYLVQFRLISKKEA